MPRCQKLTKTSRNNLPKVQRIGQPYPRVEKQQGLGSEHPRAATKLILHWGRTTADTHNEKLNLNYHSINKQPRSLNFPTPVAYIQKLYSL